MKDLVAVLLIAIAGIIALFGWLRDDMFLTVIGGIIGFGVFAIMVSQADQPAKPSRKRTRKKNR